MKTAEQMIKSAFKPDFKGDKFDPKSIYWNTRTVKRLMKRYAKEVIKEHLSRAAENAGILQVDTEYNYQTGRRDPVYDVDRESITNIDIELP